MKNICCEIFVKEQKSLDYIDKISKNINTRIIEILKFFNLKKIKKSLRICLWDNLEDYRIFAKTKLNKNIPEWLCGWVENQNECYIIHSLTQESLNKCKSHETNSLQDLENIIIHEFVHIVIKNIANTKTKRWLTEALATVLSNQKHTLMFNQTIEDFYNDDFIDYRTFQLIGEYLITQTSKEYILKLLTQQQLIESETPQIYKMVKQYLNNLQR